MVQTIDFRAEGTGNAVWAITTYYNPVRYGRRLSKSVAGRVGYVPGTIFHLKHGDVENRGYVDRQKGLASFDFDPDIDLRIGQNGAWDWARPRPDLESFIRKYFMSRAEDG